MIWRRFATERALSNQARGAFGPQMVVKNRELTARPKTDGEISFWAVLRTLLWYQAYILYVGLQLQGAL